jgi:predicted glycosyltransferase
VEQGVPYILATAGGGGDGEVMIDWVMRACEAGPSIPYDVVVVLGPFMHPEQRLEFELRAERLDRVHVIEFDNQVETLMKEAVGVVAMGGYNTFCEILTLNKRALLVPRSRPRREQTLRAERAQQLGLARMVSAENGRETRVMAQALRDLPHQTPPSEALIPGMLDGLDVVNQRVEQFISGAGVPSTESVGSGSW